MMRLTLIVALILLPVRGASAEDAALAVVQKISGTVGFYAADGRHLSDVKIGEHPHEAILSPDGRFLYVTDNGILWMTNPGEGGNTISIVDVNLRKKTGVIDLGEYRRPHGLDLHPGTGQMVVTIENPDGILLIDVANRKVLRKYDVQGVDPHMALFGPDGEWAFVSNTGSATIAAIHLETGETKLIKTEARPQGGVWSHDGRFLYVVNSDGACISIIDRSNKKTIGKIDTGKGPGRVVLTPDGKTLIYNLGSDHAVGFADISSGKETAVVPLGGQPLSLTMTLDGQRVFAGVQDQDKVFVISVADREIVQVIHTPKQAGPDPAIPLPGAW